MKDVYNQIDKLLGVKPSPQREARKQAPPIPLTEGRKHVRKVRKVRRRVFHNASRTKAARAAITQAVHFDKDTQLGTAIVRFEDLYRRSVKAADLRVALNAHEELVRLLDLKRPPTKKAAGNEELAAIRRHLLPLKLADESFPLRGHARLAAAAIKKGRKKR